MASRIKINYKEYPECMFALLAAFLPQDEGRDLRRVAGGAVVRSRDEDGRTYKNGALHSFEDVPAIRETELRLTPYVHRVELFAEWYKDGKRHRDGDLPAVIDQFSEEWYKDVKSHREGDRPAFISDGFQEWYRDGKRHRDGGFPAVIDTDRMEWYVNDVYHRDGGLPAVIDGAVQKWYTHGKLYKVGYEDERGVWYSSYPQDE